MDNQTPNYSFLFGEELNIEQRYILIYGDVDETMASTVVQAIKEMELQDDGEITIYVNSYGGDSYFGMAIVETMRTSACYIKTICTGFAASAAAEIFAAGDHRVMAKGAALMFHKASTSIDGDDADSIKVTAIELERLDRVFAERLAERSNKGKTWWLRRIKQDFYVNADLAKKLALVEDVI